MFCTGPALLGLLLNFGTQPLADDLFKGHAQCYVRAIADEETQQLGRWAQDRLGIPRDKQTLIYTGKSPNDTTNMKAPAFTNINGIFVNSDLWTKKDFADKKFTLLHEAGHWQTIHKQEAMLRIFNLYTIYCTAPHLTTAATPFFKKHVLSLPINLAETRRLILFLTATRAGMAHHLKHREHYTPLINYLEAYLRDPEVTKDLEPLAIEMVKLQNKSTPAELEAKRRGLVYASRKASWLAIQYASKFQKIEEKYADIQAAYSLECPRCLMRVVKQSNSPWQEGYATSEELVRIIMKGPYDKLCADHKETMSKEGV